MTPRIDRRLLLQMLGGAAVTGTLPWFRSKSAFAQSGAVPLRVVFFECGHGARRGTWELTSASGGPPTRTDWSLRDVMAPVRAYRDRMTMFENLDMVSRRVDPSSADNAHIDGSSHMLTAVDRFQGSGSLGGGTSIDQLIAQRLNTPEPVTRLQSLVMRGEEHGSGDSYLSDSYSAPGQRVAGLVNPIAIWDRLFPEPLGDEVTSAVRRTRIHDFVRGEYASLLERLPSEDRAKIQQMLDLKNDIHRRLSVDSVRAGNRPSRGVLDAYESLDDRWQRGALDNRRWDVKTRAVLDLAAAALHTDSTRVVTVAIDIPPNYEFGYTPGQWGTTGWHDLDHKVSGDSPDLTDADARAAIGRMQHLTYQKLAYFLDSLSGLTETDGASLLDHTLIVVVSHIAEGSHDTTRLPWMVIGDAHGRLRTGQYVQFPVTGDGDPQNASHRIWRLRGRPHNDLFVTVAQAAGVDVTTFGRPELNRGPITEMFV